MYSIYKTGTVYVLRFFLYLTLYSLTVSQMFMLQQFSMVISHCSVVEFGLHVSGVTFLFTIIRFLMRGRLLRIRNNPTDITVTTNSNSIVMNMKIMINGSRSRVRTSDSDFNDSDTDGAVTLFG